MRAGIAPLALVAGAALLALPASASALSCSYSEAGAPGPPGNVLVVSVPTNGDGPELEVLMDGRVRVLQGGEDALPVAVPCSGPPATVTSIDSIMVRIPRRNFFSSLALDLQEGPLAPGASPEPDGSPEIEVAVRGTGKRPRPGRDERGRRLPNSQFDLEIAGTFGADSFHVAASARRLRANLNASAADTDFDLLTGDVSIGIVETGAGDDTVTTARTRRALVNTYGEEGNDTLVATAGPARFSGGEGDDLLAGGGGADGLSGDEGADRIGGLGGRDFISAGAGADTVSAGAGNDRVNAAGDGEPDAIDCGRGHDVFTRDPSDRLSRCERRFVRRRGPFEQPEPG